MHHGHVITAGIGDVHATSIRTNCNALLRLHTHSQHACQPLLLKKKAAKDLKKKVAEQLSSFDK